MDSKKYGYDVDGLELSRLAVAQAKMFGVKVEPGTADTLPFDDEMFDIVIYGFCLYLYDHQNLFKIAYEADRVLKENSWVLIMDFFSPQPVWKEYHRKKGVFTTKMDYRKLFSWHPAYANYFHRICDHSSGEYTDKKDEWISISLLRKLTNFHD